MYCRKCGAEIDDEAVICVHCGVAQNNMTNQVNVDPLAKSKLAAGLLAILVGSLGIHNFYLGFKEKAIVQLLLTVVGWIVIVGPIISGVWALIEGIMIFTGSIDTDASGRKLKE
ncbi:MAG: TM2 domain-containing protein [Acholeplasma sp.]|nr:TM2 domain-containing protein [Acholeplasma sp.]